MALGTGGSYAADGVWHSLTWAAAGQSPHISCVRLQGPRLINHQQMCIQINHKIIFQRTSVPTKSNVHLISDFSGLKKDKNAEAKSRLFLI